MNKEELKQALKEEFKKNIQALVEELDQLGAEWERFRVDEEEQKKVFNIANEPEKFTLNNPIVRLSAVAGNPRIGKAELTNDCFLLDILVPSVEDGYISVEVRDDELSISIDEDWAFTKKFSLQVKSDELAFLGLQIKKIDGVLKIYIPRKDKENIKKEFNV